MPTTTDESNLVTYARAELQRAGLFDPDSDYGGMLGQAVLDIVEKFAEAGHSGTSAAITISILEKLLRYEPLTALTYEPDEWNEVGDGMWQNRRKSDVFSKDGGATWYDLAGNTGARD